MIRTDINRFAIRRLVQTTLFVILAATAAVPALGQTSGTWTITGSPHTPRTGHSATLLPNGEVLIAGGTDANGKFLTSAELFNPATGKWTVTGSMSGVRRSHSATLLPNGEVLVAGGLIFIGPSQGFVTNTPFGVTYTNTAELYNPATGRWTTTGSMAQTRSRHGAVLLRNGKVLVAGGIQAGIADIAPSAVSITGAELYDPATGNWSPTGSMNVARAIPVTLMNDGRVLAAITDLTDGPDDIHEPFNPAGGISAEVYDPAAQNWTLVASDGASGGAAANASAVLLPNGDVLLFSDSRIGQLYNPATNTWAPTRITPTTLVEAGPMVLLSNGKALVGGDIPKGFVTNSTCCLSTASMLYDPATNTWTLTGFLNHAARHTLTRLSNGQVLAVGGSAAELYTP